MAEALTALRAFAQELFKDWPEAGGVDGFELQDLAEKHGLLKRRDPAPLVPCGENCACAEYYGEVQMQMGDAVCYERSDVLLGTCGVAPTEGAQR